MMLPIHRFFLRHGVYMTDAKPLKAQKLLKTFCENIKAKEKKLKQKNAKKSICQWVTRIKQ